MSFKRYITVFIITGIIFTLTFYLSSEFGARKVREVRDLEDQIALNILSTETRYSLLENSSCEHLGSNSTNDNIGLNEELTDMAHRVKFMANQLGYDDPKVISLKKYYTLLQIKDYLLTKELYNRCGTHIVSILYLYEEQCTECVKQSIVLEDLAGRYPEIRVYWIDKALQTPALDTLISILNIKKTPSIVIKDKVYDSFQTTSDIESYIPQIAKWKKAAEDAAKDKASDSAVDKVSNLPKEE